MTFEKILSDVTHDSLTLKQAYDEVITKEKMRTINYYVNFSNISTQPMNDRQLQELHAIVGIMQVLYDSPFGSPITDSEYDSMEELLVSMGIPRNTSSVEINDRKKISHTHTRLRGTLGKIYYLSDNEPRTNKSRKSLDEWLVSASARYEKATGKKIDFNKVKILLQPKFDGCAVNAERETGRPTWITRGDTTTNQASDVTDIMSSFNDAFEVPENGAVKFEAMMPEEGKNKINEFYKAHPYSDSRQIVISIFTANDPDFKLDYLYPVPLRIIHPGDDMESIHPTLLEKIPTEVCTFGDRDVIKKFADGHRYVEINGMYLRTDGAVMTIIDHDICMALGRDNNINNYEVAYKFTEETAISKVRNIEFYVSEFGYITPVLVVNDVILKGKTVNHISLSNKERFDELALCYGDEVKVHYDIIPYATIDNSCRRAKNGRKIEYVKRCPICNEELDLDVVEVQCKNPNCPSRLIGRILNYCKCLRIKDIGYSTIETLYMAGLMDHGIRSLYKLKKKVNDIQDLEGFGKLKTKKMIRAIEGKRRLKDYEFFGALGIEDIGLKTFKAIFNTIPIQEFLDLVKLQNNDLLMARLIMVPGVAIKKAELIIHHFKFDKNRNELFKLLKEVTLTPTSGMKEGTKGRILFSKCRPSEEVAAELRSAGWEVSDSWNTSTRYLVIPRDGETSNKITMAIDKGIPVIALNGEPMMSVLKERIPNLLD